MDTLQNMRAFSCVAEAGSFTAAAAMLDTTKYYGNALNSKDWRL